MREGDALTERQNTWSEAYLSGELANYPVEMPAVGDALQLVLTRVIEIETGPRREVFHRL